ncbi:neuropilin-2-like [Orbicella faveolata]|uniref:neuropilin-2-like n=1 Tax=Orbicella faveolata TaxID=48498 RepID=UPI0009E41323|nr:neuropilin-2-like [Orbicella faveolata]
MRSGGIKESQFLSSSFYKETHFSLGHSPHQARFGGAGYWSPVGGSASIDSGQFLQIAFKTPMQLKMIVVQGKPNSTEHVRTFDALTSTNGDVWRKEKALLPKASINVKSGDSAVPTVYQSLSATRFLRIQPRSWYKESTLRIEVYGCLLSAAQTQGLVLGFSNKS